MSYENLYEDGLKFQDFCIPIFLQIGMPLMIYGSKEMQLKGENMNGIELKLDRKIKDRLLIEYQEKSKANNEFWVDSGILKKDNSYLYAVGNEGQIWLLPRKVLVRLFNLYSHGSPVYTRGSSATGRWYYLPIEEADYYCVNKWTKDNGWENGNEDYLNSFRKQKGVIYAD